MKKQEQEAINNEVLAVVEDYNSKYSLRPAVFKRLRTMSADVATVGKYHVLRSYRTIIAVIDTDTDTLYDFLRYVYGYTATSAKHVSAFNHDYSSGTWGCSKVLTYRAV